MMKRILLAVLLWITTQTVYACSCSENGPTIQDALSKSGNELIALARVALVEPQGDFMETNITHFEVIEQFKGQITNSFQTTIGTKCCVCRAKFTKGISYLVFADKREDGALYVHMCSRTTWIERSKDDLEFLRQNKVNQLLNPTPIDGSN